MKFSNFEVTDAIVTDIFVLIHAEVDIEKGFFFFKKKERIKVYKDLFFWRYADNGRYTPYTIVEGLYSAWKASRNLPSEYDVVNYMKEKKKEQMP